MLRVSLDKASTQLSDSLESSTAWLRGAAGLGFLCWYFSRLCSKLPVFKSCGYLLVKGVVGMLGHLEHPTFPAQLFLIHAGFFPWVQWIKSASTVS